MKTLLLAATAALALAAAPAANATIILTFGQSGSGNTITGTNPTSSSTHIAATAVPVTISQIDAVVVNPTFAFLTLSANNVGAALSAGSFAIQEFSGSFSITNGATNYLSGTFTDATFGSGNSLTLAASNGTPGQLVNFTSNVIAPNQLGNPEGISLSFSNVTPAVGTTGSPATLAAFTAGVAGTFAASPVPEPAALALLGVGLLGLGMVVRRKRD